MEEYLLQSLPQTKSFQKGPVSVCYKVDVCESFFHITWRKICDDCRNKLAKASFPQNCDSSVSDSESDNILSPPSNEEL